MFIADDGSNNRTIVDMGAGLAGRVYRAWDRVEMESRRSLRERYAVDLGVIASARVMSAMMGR